MTGLTLPALFGLSFSAGVATFFAPCAFPLLPGYLSYFLSDTISEPDGGRSPSSTTHPTASSEVNGLVSRIRQPLVRAAVLSALAGLGMTLVYVGLAGTTAFLGAQALADIAVLEVVVGSVFLLTGGAMAAGWKPSWSTIQLPARERSLTGFFVFGVLYAAAAAGCTAPLFIAVVLQGISVGPVLGVGAAVSYALGMSTILAAVTGVTALGSASITTKLNAYTEQIYRIAGGLLAVSGIAEMYYFFYGFPGVIPQ
jgi:cytochrome c-type biogenesis protein